MKFTFSNKSKEVNKPIIIKAILDRIKSIKEDDSIYMRIGRLIGVTADKVCRLTQSDLIPFSVYRLMEILDIIDPGSVTINIRDEFNLTNTVIKEIPPTQRDFHSNVEAHEKMVEEIRSYFFYEVKCKESGLIRYSASKESLPHPIRYAKTQLTPVGESIASRDKYLGLSPKFFDEKEKFLNGVNFEFRALTMEDIWELIGYVPDLAHTENKRSATRYLTLLLNDKTISSL